MEREGVGVRGPWPKGTGELPVDHREVSVLSGHSLGSGPQPTHPHLLTAPHSHPSQSIRLPGGPGDGLGMTGTPEVGISVRIPGYSSQLPTPVGPASVMNG